MLDIVIQIIDFYFKNNESPKVEDLNISDISFLEKRWSIFVTLYISGIIKGSSGNIKEIEKNIIEELIENTISALNDERFEKINIDNKDFLKIRIDEIVSRWKPISDNEIKNIDPLKSGILVIKTDYEKSATILPNISWKLITWEDFIPVLSNKLAEDFDAKNYIIYKIETQVYSNL